MPSSLLLSRSARNSESISPSSLVFVSSSCSRVLARNFFRFAATGFIVIEFATPGILSGRGGDGCVLGVAESLVDSLSGELARLRGARKKSGAIDGRRWPGRSPAHPRRATGHRTLDQPLHFASDQAAIPGQGNFRLRRHQACPPRALDALGHLVRQVVGGSILFARVGKHSHAIELLIANKIHQTLEGRVSLAGEADDKRGSQHDARDALAIS